ncbi:MAG: PAS domain-containing protein [Rhodospirillaceae bacterium]|nr:PAS domain-containing protein [Rhodospirillaceae bacterium]
MTWLVVVLALALVGAVAACGLERRRLLRRQAWLAAALEVAPVAQQVVARDGTVRFANAAYRRLLGDSGRPVTEVLAESLAGDGADPAPLASLVSDAVGGRPGQATVTMATARGAAVARTVSATPLPETDGDVSWVVEDAAVTAAAEEATPASAAAPVYLLDGAPVGLYAVDEAGRFRFLNATLAGWLGVARDAATLDGLRLHDLLAVPPPAGTPAHSPFAEAGAACGWVALRGPSGGSFEAHVRQSVVADAVGGLCICGVVHDLGGEDAPASAQSPSERIFRRFFEEAPVGITLLDAEGRLEACNAAFRTMVGAADEQLRGLPLTDLVVPDDRAQVSERLERLLGDGDRGEPLEVRLAGPAGTVATLYVSRHEEPRGAGLIAHFIDITQRRNLEMQFTQSQKMQAVGQLAGGIAHDFNNLLTAMIGFCDLLLLRHRAGDQSFADILQIKQNANRAANLVRQLLAFSRQQTLQPKVINVTDVLAEISHLLRRLIGENIELQMIHGRDLGVVKVDQGQLEQVIINLAVNARDAMPRGGSLIIRTSNVTTARPHSRGAETMPPGDYVLIEVADTGTGIAPVIIDRIFEPFFSTKEVGSGTGLGLSTVYGIVKQTGGFIFVDSRVGEGTSFSIYLPRYAAVAEAARREAAADTADITGSGTVLLVEDEDAVRLFSARALRNKGYNVLEARSGEAALEILAANARKIDLVITDVVMPRMDGPTLIKEIRAREPDIKVIFISGYAEDSFRKRLDEHAGTHFLQKPFSLKQLAGKVKEVMRDTAAPAA